MYRKLCLLLAGVCLTLSASSGFAVPHAAAQSDAACLVPVVIDEIVLDEMAPLEGTDTGASDTGVSDTGVSDTGAGDTGAGDTGVSDTANAGDTTDSNTTDATGCSEPAVYPGPFANTPVVPSSPYEAPGALNGPAQVDTIVTEAVDPPPSSTLAHSGSEIFVLAYLGTGMLAFGAVALGMRRSALVR